MKKQRISVCILSVFLLIAPVCGMANTLSMTEDTDVMLVQASQQQGRVTGIVVDNSAPVAGASIVVKGTGVGTISDIDGNFTLNGLKSGSVLVISFLGFTTQEITYTGQSSIRVTLNSTALDIEEVVVIAYGVTKKATFTGSAALVKADKIEKISGSQFLETLQGMSPGVNITNNEGNPGSKTRIQIRGISSMSGNSTPLYVVDGVPYDGDLRSIASSDIESLTVLKDAAASSLYGSRAANGVIVITTKKGKSGKPVINFKGTWGTSDNAVPNPVKADPYEHMLYTWKGAYNDQVYKHNQTPQAAGDYASRNVVNHAVVPRVNSKGETVFVTPFKSVPIDQYVLHDGNGNPYANPALEMVWDKSDYDWYGAVFSHKLRQDYSFDISGATADNKTNYYVSASHLNDYGYSIAQYFKRYSFRANITSEIKSWLRVGGNLAYSYSRQNVTGSNRMVIFSNTLNSPYLRNADNTDWEYSQKTGRRMMDFGENTSLYFGIHALNGMGGRGDYWDNPDDDNFNNNEGGMTTALYFAELNLPYDIKFKTNVNYDDITSNVYGYGSAVQGAGQLKPYGVTVMTNGGSATRQNYKTRSLTWNNLLTWEKSLGDHTVNALLGHEFYSKNYMYNSGYGEGIMQLDQYELASTTRNWSVDSFRDRYALLSFFGKVDYNFQNKYYLSASLRRDGSSRFHPDHRWGNFSSVGASWRISKEKFLSDVSWLTNLSLRGSYGTSGNDKLIQNGNEIWYAYQAYYSNYDLYGQPGYRPSANAAPDLKWELNQQYNLAADFSLFSRLSGTIEYYTRNSKDLLATKDLPYSANAGAPSFNTNLGDIRNNGFEFSLNVAAIQRKNFNWTIDANFTTLKNEIINLPGGEYTYGISRSNYIMSEGHSLIEHYLPKNAGVNPDNGMLRYWIRDGNGGWKTTENWSDVTIADYQFVGSAIPKGFGSITNSFKYNDFDFSFMWYGSYGSKMYSYQFVENTTVRDGVSVVPSLVKGNYWEKPGDNALFPRPSQEGYGDNGAAKGTDFYLLDNSFLRLRNITLGYTLPKNLLRKLDMLFVRIYITGDNLLTFSEAASKFTDPESGLYGNDYNGNGDNDSGIQGSRRVFMGGIQVTF